MSESQLPPSGPSLNLTGRDAAFMAEVRLLNRNPDWRRDLPDSRAEELSKRLYDSQDKLTDEEGLEVRAILGKLDVNPILTLEPLCVLALTSIARRSWALAEIIQIFHSWELIEERVSPQSRVTLRTKARGLLQDLLKEFPKNREMIRFFASLIAKDSGTMDAISFLEEHLILKAPVEDLFLSFLAHGVENSQNATLFGYILQDFDGLRVGAGYHWYVFDFHRAVILSSVLENEAKPTILERFPRTSLEKFGNFSEAMDRALETLNSLPVHIGIDLLRGIGAIRLFWHSRVAGAEEARQRFIFGIITFLEQTLSDGQRAAVLWVLAPCLDRTENFWSDPTFRHDIARRILEVARSLPEPQKSFFTGRYSYVLEDYDAAKESFSRYAKARPEAHFFGNYIDHREVGELVRDAKHQALPKFSLDFLRNVGEVDGPSLVSSANLDYFLRYAQPYVESLKKFGPEFHLHFHVFGCHGEARAHLEKVIENCQIKKVSLSSENVFVNAPYYFATARFLYLGNWSKIFKAPLILTDIDLQWRVDPTKFLDYRMKDGDVGLALNHSVRSQRTTWPASSRNRYPELLANAVRAWVVVLRGNAASEKFAEFLSVVTNAGLSAARSRSPNSNWYVDQVILGAVFAYFVRAFPNVKFSDLRDIPHGEEALLEREALLGPPHHWLASPSLSHPNLAKLPLHPEKGSEMTSSPDPILSFQNDALELSRKILARLDELATLQHFALLGPEKIHEFLCRDESIRMYLPQATTDLIQRHILRTGVFFEMILLDKFRRLIPKNAIVIDAGANIGNHSVYFAKVCGAQTVHSFEPMTQTFKVLQRNADLNAPEKIKCYNIALGVSHAKGDLIQFYPGNLGTARVQNSEGGRYQIRPLDSFQFPEVHVLKIDVEGSEINVLQGAQETLGRCKPTIWVELLPNFATKSDEMLRSLGYERIESLSPTDFVYGPRGG